MKVMLNFVHCLRQGWSNGSQPVVFANTSCVVMASKAAYPSASVITSLLAVKCLTTNSVLIHNDLQQWGSPPPTPTPEATDSQQPQTRTGLSACRPSPDWFSLVGQSVSWIAIGYRQHSHFWFQCPWDPWARFLFYPRHVHILKCGPIFDEGGVGLSV
jgi:hypothetical protein